MIPVEISAARSVEALLEGYYEMPDNTIGGVVCGRCTDVERRYDRKADQVHHASVQHVRYCYDMAAYQDAEAKAELEAERRNERFWEERGAGMDDPRDWGGVQSLYV
jgi:hypothetical protein